MESQFAYPGHKEGGPAVGPVRLCGEPIRLSWGQGGAAGEPVRFCGQRRKSCRKANSLVFCLFWGRRASSLVWRANSLILGTKKEELPESQFACVESLSLEDLPESQFACASQFAYPGDKEGRLESQFACERRRTCRTASSLVWRANSLILGTKKEELPKSQFASVESQFAYPGDKKGGPAGGLVCGDKEGGPAGGLLRLSSGQRRRTCWRASSPAERLIRFAYAGDKEGGLADPCDKEGGLVGGLVLFC